MKCDVCGKNKKTATTSYTGEYCKDCYLNVIKECLTAINEINGFPKKISKREQELKDLIDSLEDGKVFDTSVFFKNG